MESTVFMQQEVTVLNLSLTGPVRMPGRGSIDRDRIAGRRVTAQNPAPPGAATTQTPAAPGGAPAPGTPQAAAAAAGSVSPIPAGLPGARGLESLFDGKTLTGWSGDNNWKVEDGAITIESTCEKPTGTVYLVWKGGEAATSS